MARLTIRLLGPVQVSLDGEALTRFESEKTRALLAYLAAEPQRSHRREFLAEMLWPDRLEGAARGNLRHTLAHLRGLIGDRTARPPFLLPSRHTIQFNQEGDAWVDVAEISALLARPVPADPSPDLHTARQLESAVELCRGYFLEDLSLGDSTAFEEWRVLRREHYNRLVLDALWRLAEICQGRGDYGRALTHARRALELEPWDEAVQQQVMRLLALVGRRAEALAQYETCRRVLADELGAEPAAETRRLYEQIQRSELGPKAAPEIPSPVPVWRLPASHTPFFGRVDELAAVEKWLANPDLRLLTLTGPGGSGKTRLALEAGSRLAEQDRQALAVGAPLAFPHGILFLPLAAVDSVEGLISALADALQLRLQRGQEQLLEVLKRRHLLLILDNLEHLLAGVGLVAEMLQAAPGIQILATSRERLQLQGERVHPLGGLEYPDHDFTRSSWKLADVNASVAASPALQLLIEGINRIRPHFDLAAGDLPLLLAICRQVNGLPLALELTASWADALSLRDILAGVQKGLAILQAEWRNVPERHRSMRAAFDVSWQRLGQAEQTTFSQLSVFRGGFTLESARRVTNVHEPILTLLAALVRKSFLLYDQGADRYQIHELLRQYGAEKLAQEPAREAEIRDRHSLHFCAWLGLRGANLRGSGQKAAMAEIGPELENVRAACLWAAAHRRPDRVNEALYALGVYYRFQGALEAGQATLSAIEDRLCAEPALSPEAELGVQLAIARITVWRSVFASLLGDASGSIQLARRALEILDSDPLAEQDTRSERGTIYLELGYAARDTDPQEARRQFERSKRLYCQVGDQAGIADAWEALGRAARNLRDWSAAELAVSESLRLRQDLGDEVGTAASMALLGHIMLWQGNLATAEDWLRQSMAESRDDSSLYLCQVLLLSGRFEEASRSAKVGASLYLDIGLRRESAYCLVVQGQCRQHLGSYEAARVKAKEALTMARAVHFPRGIGMSLGLLGALALAEGSYEKARDRCAESLAVWQQSVGHASEFEGELACLGLAARGMGNRRRAQEHVCSQLVWARESQMLMPALYGLVGISLLLADEGEVERAIELYALASRYPYVANSRWFAEVAGGQITETSAILPAPVASAARARGRAGGLVAIIGELATGK